MLQLDLFEPIDPMQEIKLQNKALKESYEKVRKALFARHGELAKMYVELVQRMDVIERNLCRK